MYSENIAEKIIFKRYFVFENWFIDGQQLQNDMIAWNFTIVDGHVTELFEFMTDVQILK